MDNYLELLKYTLPSIVVFLTAYLLVRSLLTTAEKKNKQEQYLNTMRMTLPIKLQAYERAILFLERISPNSLIKRLHKKDMTVADLQSRMIAAINAEFEHNVSQQLYMSHQAWQMVVKAKENTIKLINTYASQIKPDVSSITLSKNILEAIIEMDQLPTNVAIEFLKKEVQGIL